MSFFAEWLLGASPSKPARQELDLKMLLAGPEFLPELVEQTWVAGAAGAWMSCRGCGAAPRLRWSTRRA